MSAESAGTYLLIALILSVLNIGFLCIIFYQKKEIKDLLHRRNSNNQLKNISKETEYAQNCKNYCIYKDELIPELKHDIEVWKSSYKEQQQINAILESTNAKLRIRKTEENNND